jgi:serine/threonine protein kinase
MGPPSFGSAVQASGSSVTHGGSSAGSSPNGESSLTPPRSRVTHPAGSAQVLEGPTDATNVAGDARYQILQPLGAGGLAKVFLGHDRVRNELVALKQPKRLDDEELDRLADELRYGRMLTHRGLVETRELVTLNGHPTLVLGYVEGRSLRTVISEGRLQPQQVARVGVQLADALGYLHSAKDRQGRPLGALHRDLTPANVILDAEASKVTLIDLGLCASQAALLNAPKNMLMGTLRYLAPEVVTDHRWSPASDFWSLGLVLFELAIGRRLFEGTEAQIIGQIVTCAFLNNGEWSRIPADLARALRGLLDPEPASRVRTATEAIGLLAEVESVNNPPPLPLDAEEDALVADEATGDLDVHRRLRSYVQELNGLRAPTAVF